MHRLRREWLAPLLLALAWGLGPALPALLRGELLGSPYTDLYPSVWGLWWFAHHQPGLPTFAPELAWPSGMGFYYSSPLHGWAATPLLPFLPLPWVYDLLLLAARLAGPLLAWAWLRAEGLDRPGALFGAALYGCAPLFHGYAVEGIVEGVDGWTLPLWGLLAARRRPLAASLAFALVVASSWYLGAAGLLVALARSREGWRHPLTALAGSLLALPLLLAFLHAMPGGSPLDPAVRAAMGTPLQVPRPGLLPGLNPFARSSYLGWLALPLLLLGARRRPWLAAGALLAWLLSLGRGPLYQLPPLLLLRFPYRLVAATLFLGALFGGEAVDRLAARRPLLRPLGLLVALEGLLLSPVEAVIPGSPAEISPVYAQVEPTVLLELPGPLALPPGQVNRSRPRARYLLYAQAFHRAASPWAPDFNALGAGRELPLLAAWRAIDPLLGGDAPLPDPAALPRAGIRQVAIHPRELGSRRSRALATTFEAAGARAVARDEEVWLYRWP